jgi:hypothetical protein
VNDTTALEARVKVLENLCTTLLNMLASTTNLAGNALQNSLANQPGIGSSDGGSPSIIYTTSAGTARNGNTAGSFTFQFVNGLGMPPVFTSTGQGGDAGQTGYNVTGGATPANAYGIALNIGGLWYAIVLDCLNTVNPAPPATPTSVVVTQANAYLLFQNGDAQLTNP